MLSGAQASIYSSFSNDEIDLLLDIICKRIKVGTSGLFREQGVIDELMELFEEKIHDYIKNPENTDRQNGSEAIDSLIAETKVCIKETKLIPDINGIQIERTSTKSIEIAVKDESHYWACLLKRILIHSDYLERGNFKTVINWHVFLNQLHTLLARYKVLLENTVKEGVPRPDFSIIPTEEITKLYFEFCGQCRRDGFESYVRVAHDFMYILKSFMSEQSINYDDGSMLVGGAFVEFFRISEDIDDALPDCNVLPRALKYYFMSHMYSCLLVQEEFSIPFEDAIDSYKDYSQNEDLLKNMEREITNRLWKGQPLVLPLKRNVCRIASDELEIARTDLLFSSSSCSSSSSSSLTPTPTPDLSYLPPDLSSDLTSTKPLSGLFSNFSLFKKKSAPTPAVVSQKKSLHADVSKTNLGRRGSSVAFTQGQISKVAFSPCDEPLTPRGKRIEEAASPRKLGERRGSSPHF